MLVADLHIHTTWSDGRLSIPEVVDLFGRSGHDVIAITDHIVNGDSAIGKVTHRFGLSVRRDNFAAYRAEIDSEARRAWDEYRMIVIAGAVVSPLIGYNGNGFVDGGFATAKMNFPYRMVFDRIPRELSPWRSGGGRAAFG